MAAKNCVKVQLASLKGKRWKSRKAKGRSSKARCLQAYLAQIASLNNNLLISSFSSQSGDKAIDWLILMIRKKNLDSTGLDLLWDMRAALSGRCIKVVSLKSTTSISFYNSSLKGKLMLKMLVQISLGKNFNQSKGRTRRNSDLY